MYKIGLTGNYLSGQDEIEKVFQKIGVKVFDADLVLKYLLNYSKDHIKLIKSSFGESIYSVGLLNLSKLQTNKEWNQLIDVVEFDIVKSYERFRLTHKNDFYTVFKYSYLYERKLSESMDFTINCHRPKSYRKEDMLLLTYLDTTGINKILNNEMDEYYKNEKSDFTIANYTTAGTMINLESKVIDIHDKITKKKPQETISNLGYKYSSGYWD